MHCKPFYLAVAMLLFATAAGATELTYTPINPSFGGYALNGSFLLSEAEAQNDLKDPDAVAYSQQDPLQSFEDSLVRRIMSSLASKVANEAFGTTTGDLADGHYVFGDYSIDVVSADGLNINVSILDLGSGNSTSIDIPYYGAP